MNDIVFAGPPVEPNGVFLEARTKHWATKEDLPDKGFDEKQWFNVFRVHPQWTSGTFTHQHSEIEVGKFCFQTLPGCCGVVVSCFTHLNEKSRHSGMSQMFRDLKQQVAKECGYTMMLATCDAANIPAAGSFLKSYHVDRTFINKRTNHLIWLGSVQL